METTVLCRSYRYLVIILRQKELLAKDPNSPEHIVILQWTLTVTLNRCGRQSPLTMTVSGQGIVALTRAFVYLNPMSE